MQNSALTPKPWQKGRLAQPHGPSVKTNDEPNTEWNAAKLLRTTIGDYAKFLVAVMRH